MADKKIEEDKGLEKEIEGAVDRLFVEKGGAKGDAASPIPIETPRMKEMKPVGGIPPIPPLMATPAGPLEKLETYLLSLEWEITGENLRRTAEEVSELRRVLKDDQEIGSHLDHMSVVLDYMIQNEEAIGHHLLQFLFDSKETIKLLMRKETDPEIGIYKKLAHGGMEARFACLEEIRRATQPTPVKIEEREEKKEEVLIRPELYEDLFQKMASFEAKLDEMIVKMDQHLAVHERAVEVPKEKPQEEIVLKTEVTIFKIGEKLFGVESDKVFKLFKLPVSLRDKFIPAAKVRLKGIEVSMIALEPFFAVSEEERTEERQILILKDNGEYKGIMIDRILNRMVGAVEQGEGWGESILGMVRWTYEDLPIRIPILDLKKL